MSNHLLTSYHSRNLQFLIPRIFTRQESGPPFMHRNQFSHHYTMHQNNILRTKVEGSGIESKQPSSKGKCSGIFKIKKERAPRLYASPKPEESFMAQSFLIQIWKLRPCPARGADCHISPCTSVESHVNIFTRSAASLFTPSEITNQ